MIFLFPNLDTFRLAVTGGVLGPDVLLSPAAVSFDADGRPHVEAKTPLPKAATDALKRLGVKGARRHAGAPEMMSCWLQALPVVREAAAPVASQAPVLFELASADELPALVGEMLRLGNDRQGFRRVTLEEGDERVLLRVVGPPYYSLLRALEPGPVRAYVEHAPRVWVEIGHTHPMARQLQAAEGQLVLIRPPRRWLFLDDAPFQDVYDILQFPLSAAATPWADAGSASRIAVPLRLAAGNAADKPELWVLRDDGVAQLDALVRDAADTLTQRLLFAVVADGNGGRAVVLRTRPSKLDAPVLPLEDAVGFKPYSKLPNLFVPAGRRLQPTLRRDVVRQILADDPDAVVWLFPDADGHGFTPESVPDGAFRPLEDWVDYLIEAEQRPLAAWIEATRFDFEHFICQENAPKPPKDTGRGPDGAPADDSKDLGRAAEEPAPRAKPGARPAAAEFAAAVEEKPNEWLVRRKELEDVFVQAAGPLDAPSGGRCGPRWRPPTPPSATPPRPPSAGSTPCGAAATRPPRRGSTAGCAASCRT